MSEYLHGYDQGEFHRLVEQAEFLGPEIFQQIDLSFSKQLLEPGCGAGAQTRFLAMRAPSAQILSFDRAEDPIAFAKNWLKNTDTSIQSRIRFIASEAMALQKDYADTFDACYICWMLEHVPDPVQLLKDIKPLLQKNARIFITEVQNDTLRFFPECPLTMQAWEAICKHQLAIGGDPYVGNKCAGYLAEAGFSNIEVLPHLMIRSKDAPSERDAMVQYWAKLMYSAVRFIDQSLWDGVEEELTIWLQNKNARFEYTFVQSFGSNV